ncbi:MAG: hypothetical protein ACJ71M_16170, partial [Nitrososphaeraceae archaeon]
ISNNGNSDAGGNSSNTRNDNTNNDTSNSNDRNNNNNSDSNNNNNSIHKQQWKSASEIKIPSGHILGRVEPIFRKIQPKDIELQKTKLGRQEQEQQQ